MANWQRVASTSEIGEGQIKRVRMAETDIVVVRVHGEYYAVHNRCTHTDYLMHRGRIAPRRHALICPGHYAEFDVRSGEVIKPPEGGDQSNIRPITTYAVRVEGTDVLVNLPE